MKTMRARRVTGAAMRKRQSTTDTGKKSFIATSEEETRDWSNGSTDGSQSDVGSVTSDK